MDYSQLSDRDIDGLVLQKIYGNQSTDKYIMRSWLKGGFKFTSNPADAWPIIEKQLIRITPVIIGGSATWVCSRDIHASAGDKPLRAAMIVFLMMQDAKHA